MNDKVKEAQLEWEKRIEKITDVLPCSNSQCGMREYEVSAKINSLLTEYRQALKRQIEHTIKEMDNDDKEEFSDEEIYFATTTLKAVLELIDTCKP